MLFRRLSRRIAEEVQSRLGPDRIVLMDDRANSLGVESRGKAQIRGNGCLALTPDEIVFAMWIPRRETRIARDRITGVERVRSHLGKSVFRPLLKVSFTNETGQADSIAWFVRDLPSWEAALG